MEHRPPSTWRWETRDGLWWRVNDELRVRDGPHHPPIVGSDDDAMLRLLENVERACNKSQYRVSVSPQTVRRLFRQRDDLLKALATLLPAEPIEPKPKPAVEL